MSEPNDFKRPPLTIQGDVAAYARKAADALDSSGKFLRDRIEIDEEIDPEGDCPMEFKRDELKVTATNLTQAAAFLRWLADFEHEGGGNDA